MATAAAAAAAMPTPAAPWSSVTLKMERRSEAPPEGPPSAATAAAGERGSAGRASYRVKSSHAMSRWCFLLGCCSLLLPNHWNLARVHSTMHGHTSSHTHRTQYPVHHQSWPVSDSSGRQVCTARRRPAVQVCPPQPTSLPPACHMHHTLACAATCTSLGVHAPQSDF